MPLAQCKQKQTTLKNMPITNRNSKPAYTILKWSQLVICWMFCFCLVHHSLSLRHPLNFQYKVYCVNWIAKMVDFFSKCLSHFFLSSDSEENVLKSFSLVQCNLKELVEIKPSSSKERKNKRFFKFNDTNKIVSF